MMPGFPSALLSLLAAWSCQSAEAWQMSRKNYHLLRHPTRNPRISTTTSLHSTDENAFDGFYEEDIANAHFVDKSFQHSFVPNQKQQAKGARPRRLEPGERSSGQPVSPQPRELGVPSSIHRATSTDDGKEEGTSQLVGDRSLDASVRLGVEVPIKAPAADNTGNSANATEETPDNEPEVSPDQVTPTCDDETQLPAVAKESKPLPKHIHKVKTFDGNYRIVDTDPNAPEQSKRQETAPPTPKTFQKIKTFDGNYRMVDDSMTPPPPKKQTPTNDDPPKLPPLSQQQRNSRPFKAQAFSTSVNHRPPSSPDYVWRSPNQSPTTKHNHGPLKADNDNDAFNQLARQGTEFPITTIDSKGAMKPQNTRLTMQPLDKMTRKGTEVPITAPERVKQQNTNAQAQNHASLDLEVAFPVPQSSRNNDESSQRLNLHDGGNPSIGFGKAAIRGLEVPIIFTPKPSSSTSKSSPSSPLNLHDGGNPNVGFGKTAIAGLEVPIMSSSAAATSSPRSIKTSLDVGGDPKVGFGKTAIQGLEVPIQSTSSGVDLWSRAAAASAEPNVKPTQTTLSLGQSAIQGLEVPITAPTTNTKSKETTKISKERSESKVSLGKEAMEGKEVPISKKKEKQSHVTKPSEKVSILTFDQARKLEQVGDMIADFIEKDDEVPTEASDEVVVESTEPFEQEEYREVEVDDTAATASKPKLRQVLTAGGFKMVEYMDYMDNLGPKKSPVRRADYPETWMVPRSDKRSAPGQ